jgi:hypothetical protein
MDLEPTTESIESEFPGWHVWQGVNYLWYARLEKSSPPVVVMGEDLLDLRDQVKGWCGRSEWYQVTYL